MDVLGLRVRVVAAKTIREARWMAEGLRRMTDNLLADEPETAAAATLGRRSRPLRRPHRGSPEPRSGAVVDLRPPGPNGPEGG